jgi:hypothetical protein
MIACIVGSDGIYIEQNCTLPVLIYSTLSESRRLSWNGEQNEYFEKWSTL